MEEATAGVAAAGTTAATGDMAAMDTAAAATAAGTTEQAGAATAPDTTATQADQLQRPVKHARDSRTEVAHTVMKTDINGENRLFGGRLMEWIDDAAGIAARRHCMGSVTTACVDQLVFRRPAYLNDIVVIIANVTYVGNTSMEVHVESYVENVTTGTRSELNRAYLIEIHVDADGRPQPVHFGLALDTNDERAEWEAAQKRFAIRKQRTAERI